MFFCKKNYLSGKRNVFRPFSPHHCQYDCYGDVCHDAVLRLRGEDKGGEAARGAIGVGLFGKRKKVIDSFVSFLGASTIWGDNIVMPKLSQKMVSIEQMGKKILVGSCMIVACSQILYCFAKRDNNNCSIPRPLPTFLETRLVVWPLCAVHHRPPSQGEVAAPAAAAAAAAADGIDWLRGPLKKGFLKKIIKELFRGELRGVHAAVFLLLLFVVVLFLFPEALD